MTDPRSRTVFGGTVVVTGGVGVIGSGVAANLRGQGVTVVVWDRVTEQTSDDSKVDLSDAASVQDAMAALFKHHRAPYSFVMAHGVHELSTLNDLTCGDFGEAVMNGNFMSVVNVVASAVALDAPPSRFVLLGSIAARTPIAFSPIYSASKSAAEVFLEAAGYELEMLGHSWSIINVGGVNSGFNEEGLSAGVGTLPVSDAFNRVAKRIHSQYGVSPKVVSGKLADCAIATKTRSRYTIGLKANIADAVGRVGGLWGRRLLVGAALLRSGDASRRRG